ncbi:MAG: hypothetical protein K6F57_05315 [Candidatus Saccharibacteria bacterium]|nr:hypothetical protein [Candidatus Saccharibacteria bacterium]
MFSEENETPVINQPDSASDNPPTPEEATNPEPIPGGSSEASNGTPAINLTEQFQKEHPVAQTPLAKKSGAGKIIGIIVALLVIAGLIVAAIIFIPKLFGGDKTSPSEHTAREPEAESFNSYEKLSMEYKLGAIDVSEYFDQLVNISYDEGALNEIYKADEGSEPDISHDDEIIDLIKKNSNKLNKETIQFFINEYSQNTYYFGTPKENKVSTAKDIQLADDEAKERTMRQRFFNQVILSENGNFLVWYTKEGEDKITDEQAKNIGATLEKSIAPYEQLFGYKYEFRRNVNTANPARELIAKAYLKANKIDTKKLDTAMSVFVYETNSDDVLATYYSNNDLESLKPVLEILKDLIIKEEYLNYPYIRIDQDATEDLAYSSQVINHEFVHHFQYLYCANKTSRYCPGGTSDNYLIYETVAQFGSSRVSDPYDKGYLGESGKGFAKNIHNGLYVPGDTLKTDEYIDNVYQSYRDYPYLIGYVTEAGGKMEDVMAAHLQTNPLGYLKSHATDEQLHTAITKTAGYALSNKYPSNHQAAVNGDFPGPKMNKLNYLGTHPDRKLNPGAIVFYEIEEGASIHLESDNELVSFVLFDENKNEAWHSDKSEVDIDTNMCLKGGKKCYLAYANGDIDGNATVSATVNHLGKEQKFATSYDNYNVDITMKMSVSGISVTSRATGAMDELHQREHLNVTSSTMGLDVKNEIYYNIHEGVSYTSAPDMGIGDLGGLIGNKMPSWTKSKEPGYYMDLGQFLAKLERNEDGVTKVDDTHYKLKINAKDIQGLIQSGGDSTKNIEMPSKDIEANITVNGGYITQIDYNFDGLAGIDDFTATAKFSNYDNAGSVYIPLTIARGAKEI